ncbi:hypothetical protein [Paenibacillus wynnii]|uniref:Uncharacterized protein n=1 Tax=Paenibacillus wynnii TaxID=268407 RepID=A0A098M7D0_9BACL|nr:hypothetical protein [Paenibacillus wynnii]KGE18479.1 hypothetical protein PWYN_03160 [Paenibacillus wynnii]
MSNVANSDTTPSLAEQLLAENDLEIAKCKKFLEESFFVTFDISLFASTPKIKRVRAVERLLKRIEPVGMTLPWNTHCTGCGGLLEVGRKVIKVKGGICCDRACHGLLLVKQCEDHGR